MPTLTLAELKKRKFFQWLLTYLASGWVALQVLDYIGSGFHWPDTVKRVATVLYFSGILAVAIAGWYHGEAGKQRVTALEVVWFVLNIAIAGVAVALVAQHRADRLAATPTVAAETNSVVVLPFSNRSSNAQDEYFSDGISEELLDALARIPNLHVSARTSSFAFKNKNIAAPEIAKQLRVHYVLEGSVERAGDVVRISARLIDGSQDQTVWTDQFERSTKDVFAVEDEISRAIAEKLRLRLTDTGAGARTRNPDAHEQYLRGRYLLAKSSSVAIKQSWPYFEQAIALDSSYAAAYASFAEALTLSAVDEKTTEVFDKAVALARRSLQLDEKQGNVHAVLGALLLWRDWDVTGAEREFKRALALNPNEANTYDYYAWVFQQRNQNDQAVHMTEEAVRIDPFSAWLSYALEFRYVNNGLYDKAIAQHKITQALDPDEFYWDLPVAVAYREKHQYDDAVREYQSVLKRLGPVPLHGLAITYARMGRTADARHILDQLLTKARAGYVPPEQIALVYANLGDNDLAFQWLSKAFDMNDGWLQGWILCDPSYTPLKSDPRYAQLITRIGNRLK